MYKYYSIFQIMRLYVQINKMTTVMNDVELIPVCTLQEIAS